jgi:hypothetical protein
VSADPFQQQEWKSSLIPSDSPFSDYILQDDLMKACRKINDAKKHETKL